MNHLTTTLFFALWQSTLLLGLALLLGQLLRTTLRKTPWQAHDLHWYGIIAAVVTPIFSTVVDVHDGGWLGDGMTNFSIMQTPLTHSISERGLTSISWANIPFGASILSTTFLTGSTLFLLLLFYGIIASRKLMFRAKPFPDRESQEALLRSSEMLQNLSLPILFTSPSVKSPTVWCWGLHPAVVLPEALADKLPAKERDAIFLHELAHIARRDHLTAFFARICGMFLFWNPLYWLCLRQADLLADEACDLMVLSKGNIEAETLAETLLRLAAGERNTPARYLSTLQFLSRKETMMKRINTILDFGEGRNVLSVRPSRLWQCSAFLVALMLSVTLAFCQTQDKPKPIAAEKAKMMGYVEDFFMNNYRDITMRKSLEWGDVQTDDKGNGTIRYKFEALIWDKDRKIMCQDFTFDKDGNYVAVKNVDGFPQDVEKPDTSTVEGMKKLVEKFFSQNYRDITKRKTLEWGEPETALPSGNRSIRYKYEATIWDKDVITQDKTFTFTKDGEFVSVNDTGSTLGAKPTPEVEAADKFMDAFLKEDYDKAISFYDEKMKKALPVDKLKQIRADLTTQFGDMTDFRAVKTESLLGYIRVHEQGNFKLGSAVFMVVVNKEQKISGFFLASSEKADKDKAPQILKMEPKNGAKDVDASAVTELRVTFDRDMGGGMSWCGGGDKFPESSGGKAKWINKRTCVFPVKLKPNKEYMLSINARDFRNFKSVDGVSVEPVVYTFTTKEGSAQQKCNADDSKAPQILKMEPENGAKDVDASAVTELRVTFDRDMAVGSHAWVTIGKGFPETTDPATWDGKRTAVLPVKLKPNETYRLALNMGRFRAFASEDGEFLKDTVYTFKTKPAKQAASTNLNSSQKLAQEGWKLFMQGNAADAMKKFEAAIEANSKNANAYQGLGWAQMNSGEQAEAKKTFEKCLDLDPKNVAALNGLGQIAYFNDEDEAAAIAHWEKAISLDKRAGGPMMGLGNLYKNRGDKENALKYYKMCLKTEPQNEEVKKAIEELTSAPEK